MKLNIFLIFLISTLLCSCAGLFENRTFINEMEYVDQDGLFIPNENFRTVAGDTGRAYRSRREIMKRTPLDGRRKGLSLEQNSIAKELRNLERKLTNLEYQAYMEHQDALLTDSEKIYYLRLDPRERESYYRSKAFNASPKALLSSTSGYNTLQNYRGPSSYNKDLRNRFDSMRFRQAIEMGMTKSMVEELWGRPSEIEVAGNPRYENERWAFFKNGKASYIYFEGGKVEAWTLD